MRTRPCFPVLISSVALLAAGCEPAPRRESEIDRTKRMIEDARRRTQTGEGRLGNVYVRLERLRVSAADSAGLGALWRYTSGRLTISGGDGLGKGGVRLGLAGGEFDAQLSAWARGAQGADRVSQEILVASGQEGYLWVGRNLLVPLLRIRGPGGTVEVLENARVGAGLRVLPRAQSDGRIELEIAPCFSRGGAGGREPSRSSWEMATRVLVRPGEKLVLGASSSAERGSAARGLFGYDAAGRDSTAIVTLEAELR
jgi:hypothetical protein